jgi:hypothetical protein
MDPGFVHKRKIQTILGSNGMTVIDEMIGRIPRDLPDWQKSVRIDHVYKDVFLKFCEIHGVKSLEEALATDSGHIVCSVEDLASCPNLFEVARAVSSWVPRGRGDYGVEFHYSTSLISADT